MGGPARQDAPKAVDALKKLNVPYMVSLPLVFQTTEEWLDSQLGVHPVQVALQVSRSRWPLLVLPRHVSRPFGIRLLLCGVLHCDTTC